MSSSNKEDMWKRLARTVISAGPLPFPITEALIEILKTLVTEEQGKFINITFRAKANKNLEQIKKKALKHYDEETIKKFLNDLMYGGVITGVPSRRTDIVVYHLMPFFPGLFEWSLLKGNTGPKEQKLAKLFDTIFGEIAEVTQRNYDSVIEQFKNFNAMDRVVPVEQEIDQIEAETILPVEELSKIIDENDTFCVVHCYCRMEKDLLGKSCKVTDDRENCIMFGKTAQFCIDHDFGKQVSKEDIKRIMKEVEDQGLVHKALHVGLDPNREITGFCNCCKCCCGILELYYRGVTPLMSYSSFISSVDADMCNACGTCEQRCPIEAIELKDAVAVVNKDKCFGCGICVHFCPEKAITLERTGPRMVFVPPPRLESKN